MAFPLARMLCTLAASAALTTGGTTLELKGEVDRPARLSLADLRRLPSHEVPTVALVCGTGEKKGVYRNARGVLLRDLLDRCGVVARTHDAHNRLYVLATASDGYQAMFSWHELFNSPVGAGVFVLYSQAGQPLPPPRGPFVLVSTRDLRNGPRHVRQLASVEVVALKKQDP